MASNPRFLAGWVEVECDPFRVLVEVTAGLPVQLIYLDCVILIRLELRSRRSSHARCARPEGILHLLCIRVFFMIGFRRLSTLLASFRVLSDSKCSLLSVFAALIFLIHAAMLLATVFPASSSAATSSTTSISGDESVRL